MRIVIIGAGNVGVNLHNALKQRGIRAELCSARALMASCLSMEGRSSFLLPEGDCYIYTVVDSALRDVVDCVHAPKALHLHTSGSMPIDVFGVDKPHAGVLYFFQSCHIISSFLYSIIVQRYNFLCEYANNSQF